MLPAHSWHLLSVSFHRRVLPLHSTVIEGSSERTDLASPQQPTDPRRSVFESTTDGTPTRRCTELQPGACIPACMSVHDQSKLTTGHTAESHITTRAVPTEEGAGAGAGTGKAAGFEAPAAGAGVTCGEAVVVGRGGGAVVVDAVGFESGTLASGSVHGSSSESSKSLATSPTLAAPRASVPAAVGSGGGGGWGGFFGAEASDEMATMSCSNGTHASGLRKGS